MMKCYRWMQCSGVYQRSSMFPLLSSINATDLTILTYSAMSIGRMSSTWRIKSNWSSTNTSRTTITSSGSKNSRMCWKMIMTCWTSRATKEAHYRGLITKMLSKKIIIRLQAIARTTNCIRQRANRLRAPNLLNSVLTHFKGQRSAISWTLLSLNETTTRISPIQRSSNSWNRPTGTTLGIWRTRWRRKERQSISEYDRSTLIFLGCLLEINHNTPFSGEAGLLWITGQAGERPT